MLDRYRPEDRKALLELHQQTRGRSLFCDPAHPLHFETFVARRDDGSLRAAVTGRTAVEAFLMVDEREDVPGERKQTVRALLDLGANELVRCGMDELHLHTHDPRFARWLSRLPGMFVGAPYHAFYLLGGTT